MDVKELTFEYLSECFDLDVETGVVRWKVRPAHHFVRDAEGWNKVYAGTVAGTLDRKGKGSRLRVRIGGRMQMLHRVVFALSRKISLAEVPGIVDHENCDGTDNRPSNLREATPGQSACNRRVQDRSLSGVKGVHWNDEIKAWRACIKHRGRTINLGRFQDIELAAAAYRDAATKLQGEFART